MNNIFVLANKVSPDAAKGGVSMILFMISLLLIFWIINTVKHYKSGSWDTFIKIVDFSGIALLGGLMIFLLIPMFR